MKKLIQYIENKYIQKSIERENAPVLDFLKNLPFCNNYKYLEVGAGLGIFPFYLKNNLTIKCLDIVCLEINKELNDNLRKKEVNSIEGSILNAPFKNEFFDIVHCSHVIEHFTYPDITKALDEIFRITKKGGAVIIRSPLLHPGFYNDIDHIRPYPPKSILQYFRCQQQQKKGKHEIELIKIWTRRPPLGLSGLNIKSFFYFNLFLKFLWIKFNFPQNKPDGYVAIFKKLT